jgi:dihydroorotase
MTELTIRLPDDWHVHLRQGPDMAAYASRTAAHFGRFMAMPNVVPPLSSGTAVRDYIAALDSMLTAAGHGPQGRHTQAMAAFKLMPGMGREAVMACAAAGAIAGKYYPAGSTTNAQDGIPGPEAVATELAAMADAGLVLSIHGEDPTAPVLEREERFLPIIQYILSAHASLRIVVEHLSSAAAVAAVQSWPDRVAGTITAHHLAFTIDDLAGDRLDSAFYCKPILKSAKDRAALQAAAISGHPRFFFGSDSAPHNPQAKSGGAAGSYSAPVAMALLAKVFEDNAALDRLEPFISCFGADFYGLPPNPGRLTLRRAAWTVPEMIDGCVPLAHGQSLAWTACR